LEDWYPGKASISPSYGKGRAGKEITLAFWNKHRKELLRSQRVVCKPFLKAGEKDKVTAWIPRSLRIALHFLFSKRDRAKADYLFNKMDRKGSNDVLVESAKQCIAEKMLVQNSWSVSSNGGRIYMVAWIYIQAFNLLRSDSRVTTLMGFKRKAIKDDLEIQP
jgi:hypothetical protein